MKALTLLALALALPGCAVSPDGGAPLTGRWGGEHVGLVLTPAGGQLDYDCAAGRIDGPVIPLGDGSFRADGTHTPGTGGPERIGEVRPSYAAGYSGRVSDDRMTLSVEANLPSGHTLLGPFTLQRGAEPRLLRCL